MLVVIATLLLMGIALGAVVHVPLSASATAGAAIALWLAVFALRERHARRRDC